jgi:hypothetical protein
LGWPDNFDHYGPGQWGPGAGDFGEDGWLEYLEMGFEAPAEGVQAPEGGGGLWDGSFEGIESLAEGFHADVGRDLGEDTLQHEWDWTVDPTELEIPRGEAVVLTRPTFTSTLPSSNSMSNDVTSSPSPGTSSTNEQTTSSLNDISSGEEWPCDFTNCGKIFSQRHRLK